LNRVDIKSLSDKKLLAFAGIGSFSGFVESLKSAGLNIGDFIRYRDHHNYSPQNAQNIIKRIRDMHLDGAITTLKDWYKIKPLLEKAKNNGSFHLYKL